MGEEIAELGKRHVGNETEIYAGVAQKFTHEVLRPRGNRKENCTMIEVEFVDEVEK